MLGGLANVTWLRPAPFASYKALSASLSSAQPIRVSRIYQGNTNADGELQGALLTPLICAVDGNRSKKTVACPRLLVSRPRINDSEGQPNSSTQLISIRRYNLLINTFLLNAF